MTKAELARRIGSRHGLKRKEAALVVDAILEGITTALIKGQRVELRGFGSFYLKKKSARTARNPKTGDRIAVPARTVASFKPSRSFRKTLKKQNDDEGMPVSEVK